VTSVEEKFMQHRLRWFGEERIEGYEYLKGEAEKDQT
jgi:hypothetical protein